MVVVPLMVPRVFLMSPANTGGPRAAMLLRPGAQFDLAQRLAAGRATIAEVYSFISGLYFRGKAAYVEAFAAPPAGVPGALVVVPGAGLLPPGTPIGHDALRAIAAVPVDAENPAFVEPLVRDARLLDEHAGPECGVVLLGSIATAKYVAPLLEVFGARLLFPAEFVGRGDMSRGGLMLRAARGAAPELTYVPVAGAVRHGKRPPKLEKWQKP